MNDDNNEAVLDAIDNGRPFSWLPQDSMMNFVTSLLKVEQMLDEERQ